MALLLTIPPGPEWPHKHSRGYYPTTQGNRTILRKRTHHGAAPRPFPSTPWDGPPYEHPATSDRLFRRVVSLNWSNLLTAADRLAWKNLAPTVTIRNFNDQLITPNGFQLYGHYERAWCTLWYDIGRLFIPADCIWDTAPYLPWTPPATPSNFYALSRGTYGFEFWYTGTPDLGAHKIHVTLTNNPPRPGKTFEGMWNTLNTWVSEYPMHSGNYHASAFTKGICPNPQPQGNYHFRVMDLDWNYPFTCSLWAPLTISI